MAVNTYHLRSSVKGKEPTAGSATGQLPVGSIAINYHQGEPFLSIQDSAGQVRRIAGVRVDATASTTATAGEFWLDTSGTDKILKIFDGAVWVATGTPVADATTALKGVARLADAAAVTAGTAGRVVTADQLKTTNDAVTANTTNITTVQGQITTIQGQVADASTTAKGIVQLADAAAITAGTAGRVVDAAQLKANVPTVADASETAKGIVELATAAETTTGTDATRAVHPAGLKVELDKKANQATTYTKTETDTALALKANLASPALTGTPTAPTAAAGTNTTQVATTAFVTAAVAVENLWNRTGTTVSPTNAGDNVQINVSNLPVLP